jgi:hypothetical protein
VLNADELISINISLLGGHNEIMASSWWLYSVFIWAVLIGNLAISAFEEDTKINDAQKTKA